MNERLIVDLEAMAPTGECVARQNGLTLFVAMGIPGERVEVEIIHRRRSWVRARIVRVIAPSSTRIAPPCPCAGHCRGCDWQHIDYAAQLEYKAGIVREQLARMGGLASAPVQPCMPSPHAFGYRNRIQLVASPRGRLGYRARQSQAVVEIDSCPIADSAINALLPGDGHAAGAQVELRAHDAGAVCDASQPIHITVGRHTYRTGGRAFFLVNTAAAALLVDEVLRALDLRGDERVLDLYCGVGLFTAPIAQAAAVVAGVESSIEACEEARYNLRDCLADASIMAMDAGEALRTPALREKQWDAVVLDPPRAGVEYATLLDLIALESPKLVYVACDPGTLARDARLLCAKGYSLLNVQPLDMFPQTHHVETVAVFTLRPAGRAG